MELAHVLASDHIHILYIHVLVPSTISSGLLTLGRNRSFEVQMYRDERNQYCKEFMAQEYKLRQGQNPTVINVHGNRITYSIKNEPKI